jgi:hypothetical protein
MINRASPLFRRGKVRCRTLVFLVVCGGELCLAIGSGQAQNSPADTRALVSEVVRNELGSQNGDKSLWAYSETLRQHGKTQSFRVVETKDGTVSELVSINGRPLSGEQKKREDRRIQKLLAHPAEMRKHRANQASDANEERKMLNMLPDAFLYNYEGRQGNEIKLHFRPNPKFRAAGHEGQVFHHMEGEMYIDQHEKRLKELDGRLTSSVKFGGGVLGYLRQGGTFSVKQQEVGGGHWEMTYLDVQMNGRALFFKTIAVRETETDSGFRRVPDGTTASRAAQFLNVQAGM